MAVTDEAIVKIKQMLLGGELRPGDRLPPEKELSEQLGLSRSSLREAVKALELIRVLELFEVRRILEPAAAAMATLRATPQDIDHLTRMLDSVGPQPSVEELVAHDVEFHSAISDLAGTPTCARFSTV